MPICIRYFNQLYVQAPLTLEWAIGIVITSNEVEELTLSYVNHPVPCTILPHCQLLGIWFKLFIENRARIAPRVYYKEEKRVLNALYAPCMTFLEGLAPGIQY